MDVFIYSPRVTYVGGVSAMDQIDRIKLHFTYCGGILIGLVILIATDRWTGQAKFTEFLTNAATMTSLFLGVVAIFYSIVSNGDLAKNLGGISKVGDDVALASTSVSQVVARSEDLLRESNMNTAELKDLSKSVGATVGSLREAMVQFEQHTHAIKASIDSLPSRFDVLEAKITESATSATIPYKDAGQQNIDDLSKLCMTQMSMAGGFAIYAAVLAFRTGKELDLNEIQAALDASSTTYLHGVLIALDSVNLFDLYSVSDKSRTLKVTRCADHFNTLNSETMREWVDMKAKRYKNATIDVAIWQNRVDAFDKYFE
jgi:hypothetical protein